NGIRGYPSSPEMGLAIMPQHSKNSAARILAAERRTQALALRRAGKHYSEIAAALGCSESRAHQIVTLELERINTERSEQAEAVRTLELQRLDVLLGAVWEKAQAGDVQAIDRVLSIQARRAKLLGLDAPSKVAHTTPDGTRSVAPPVRTAAEMSDDELANVIARDGSPGVDAPPEGA